MIIKKVISFFVNCNSRVKFRIERSFHKFFTQFNIFSLKLVPNLGVEKLKKVHSSLQYTIRRKSENLRKKYKN